MAQQFPMVKSYIGLQEEQKRTIEESIKTQDEKGDTLPTNADKAPELLDETANKKPKEEVKPQAEAEAPTVIAEPTAIRPLASLLI